MGRVNYPESYYCTRAKNVLKDIACIPKQGKKPKELRNVRV